MDNDLESNRITLALGFITAFLALFLGTDYLAENRLIFGLKLYAFISSALFFLYLLFTAISYKYKKEENTVNVGIGLDSIKFTNEEIGKVRKWSFDAGINCVFAAPFISFSYFFFQYTDNIRTLYAAILAAILLESCLLAIKCFAKAKLYRATLFTFITAGIFGVSGLLNNVAQTIIDTENRTKTVPTIEQIHQDAGNIEGWQKLLHYVARENSLSDQKMSPDSKHTTGN